jgi:RNA polymerase sigma factor (sigma-70 family)
LRYNKSIIFKNAWIIKKSYNISFSEALKRSWSQEKLKLKNINFEFVIKELDGDIKYITRWVRSKINISRDEVRQRLMIKVNSCLSKYNPEKSTIRTFFNFVLKNYAKDIIKKEIKDIKRRAIPVENEYFVDIKYQHEEPEIKEFLKNFSSRFDGREKSIYEKLIIGMKIKDIAEDMKTSHNNISNIIRRKIRPELVREFM